MRQPDKEPTMITLELCLIEKPPQPHVVQTLTVSEGAAEAILAIKYPSGCYYWRRA